MGNGHCSRERRAVELNLDAPQLRDALSRPANPQNTLGMIALDVFRIVHLDKVSAERYPVTKYGAFELPSSMVIVQDQADYYGLMFWLMWKKLFGSYFRFTSVSRP